MSPSTRGRAQGDLGNVYVEAHSCEIALRLWQIDELRKELPAFWDRFSEPSVLEKHLLGFTASAAGTPLSFLHARQVVESKLFLLILPKRKKKKSDWT